MQIKINGALYECDRMVTHIHDFEWDMRDNVELFMQMTHAEADAIFVSGIAWSYLLDDGTEIDQSDYCVAGRIIDYRNGRIGVYMGQKTEAEHMEDKAAEDLPIIQKALPSLNDEDAIKLIGYFPEWESGIEVEAGARLQYASALWRVITGHTTQVGWEPDIAPSLFERVAPPSEEGTIDNPIHYAVGMEITEGLYYLEDDIEYLCIRSSGAPLYNPLSELVGIYVEVVSNG